MKVFFSCRSWSAAADSRCGSEPFPQRRRIARPHHPQHLLLHRIGVVFIAQLVRRTAHGDAAPLPFQQLPQAVLLRIIDDDILQFQLFAVEDVIDGAQNLQDALQRYRDDAFHPCDKILRLIRRNICPEGQLLQLLDVMGDLPGRPEHDLCAAGIDDAVVVEMPGHKIADVSFYPPDILPVQLHRVFRQINQRVIESKLITLKNPDRHAGKVPDNRTDIPQIDLFHADSSHPLQL